MLRGLNGARLWSLVVVSGLVVALVAAACGETKEVVRTVEVEKPVIVEKEVIKEVPVERIIEKAVVQVVEKPVVQVVEKQVVVTKEVVKEVPKEVVVIKEVPAKAKEKVFRVATVQAIANMSPFRSGFVVKGLLHNLILSRPAQVDPTGRWVSDLAERWQVAPDGTAYTFFIRKNAVWHDGKPVTAKDVAYSFKMYLTPDTNSVQIGALSKIKGSKDYQDKKAKEVAGIVLVDDYTIRFEMDLGTPTFLIDSNLPILPAHILGSLAPGDLDKSRFFLDQMVGSGPFKMAKHVVDQFVELEANTEYYLGKPKLDRVIVRVITSPDAVQIAMQRGDIDMMLTEFTVPNEVFQTFIQDSRFNVVAVPTGAMWSYGFNHRREHLRDPRIRQAFAYALDRQKLINLFNQGNGTIKNTFLIHNWYAKPEWDALYKYDPEKAKALLKEVGWDSKREVKLMTAPLESEQARALAAAEQQMLKQVGINAVIEETERSARIGRFYDTHDYDIFRTQYGTFADPDGFLNFHMRATGRNAFGYDSPELDAKIVAGASNMDQAVRAKIYQEIGDETVRTLPLLPLWNADWWYIISSKIKVPVFAGLPVATSMNNVPTAPGFGLAGSWMAYHVEQWDAE